MHRTRDQFRTTSLLTLVRSTLSQHHKDKGKAYKISTVDALMSGLAVFSLKQPSLLQFDKENKPGKTLFDNLRTLYGVKHAPCDTQMRERLDGLELNGIRESMKSVVGRVQRGKELENWKFIEGSYLVPLDGTGIFSSTAIHCSSCLEKHHKNGDITYSHQMLVGSIVHPSLRQVLPLGFEPIIKADGATKNDCERNASKRWLNEFRRAHPKLPVIIVGDGLFSNAPFIEELEKHRCHYILGCKEDDHKYLYDWFKHAEFPDVIEFEETTDKFHQRYRFMNNVPLNESHQEKLVNVVYFEETDKKGVKRKWCWVTDIQITEKNVRDIVKGGRARWKIENETFNTLKNQGYNFEHNYGHGKKTLSNVLGGLMLLAFLIDQCLEALNLEFKQVLQKLGSRASLWDRLRSGFQWFFVESWEAFYAAILGPPQFTINAA